MALFQSRVLMASSAAAFASAGGGLRLRETGFLLQPRRARLPLLRGGGKSVEREGLLIGFGRIGEPLILLELRTLLEQRLYPVDVLGPLQSERSGLIARSLLHHLLLNHSLNLLLNHNHSPRLWLQGG